jgi:3-deoxy-7-phosphoheptulonate synthase
LKAFQQPQYADQHKYERVLSAIREYPPLVFPGEVENLKRQIARAGKGESFILQGGNCAEKFIDCNAESITNQIKILLQMSVILTYGVKKSVVRIGRIAGQYAKPRSNPTEMVDGQEIPSYFGDSVNDYTPNLEARTPNPERLLLSFHHSAATLNYIRAMIDGGFADLHYPYNWNVHSIEKTKKWPEYKEILSRILDAINFMESFGGTRQESLGRVDFYTSHEGLLLGYEEALTRKDSQSDRHYNLGAHMVWLGHRSRALDGAHVEYFRGISNPIGVKLGPNITPDELLELLEVLNPGNEEGRIMLITRMGADKVNDLLPPILGALQKSGKSATWCCDPMHGNTRSSNGKLKTRKFSVILEELEQTFRIHKRMGSYLAGVHFELTAEDVTECIGGAVDLTDDDLQRNYSSYCDPRLNYSQSLEMAFLISQLLLTL